MWEKKCWSSEQTARLGSLAGELSILHGVLDSKVTCQSQGLPWQEKKIDFFAMIGKKVDKAVEDEHNQMLQINIKQALTKK